MYLYCSISQEKNNFLEVLLAWHRKNIKSNVWIFWLKLRSTEQLKSLECLITMIQLFMTFQIMLCKTKLGINQSFSKYQGDCVYWFVVFYGVKTNAEDNKDILLHLHSIRK